jgi:hypothetical protein
MNEQGVWSMGHGAWGIGHGAERIAQSGSGGLLEWQSDGLSIAPALHYSKTPTIIERFDWRKYDQKLYKNCNPQFVQA